MDEACARHSPRVTVARRLVAWHVTPCPPPARARGEVGAWVRFLEVWDEGEHVGAPPGGMEVAPLSDLLHHIGRKMDQVSERAGGYTWGASRARGARGTRYCMP